MSKFISHFFSPGDCFCMLLLDFYYTDNQDFSCMQGDIYTSGDPVYMDYDSNYGYSGLFSNSLVTVSALDSRRYFFRFLYKNITDPPIITISWCQFQIICVFLNPLTAQIFNWNFHPLEVVSRWRDPQLQVSENYSDLTKILLVTVTCSKAGRWAKINPALGAYLKKAAVMIFCK